VDFLENLSQPEAVLFAGVIGAVGAVVASAITNFLGHVVSGRIQRSREYADVRRQAYAEVLASAIKVINSDDPGSQLETFIDAYSRATLVSGVQSTVHALNELAYAVTALGRASDEAADQRVYERMNAFHLAARKELGMSRVALRTYQEHLAALGAAPTDAAIAER
jgi:hypothetical protein